MKAFFVRLVVVGAAIALVSSVVACIKTTDTVRMGTEGAYPPYSFINEAGELDGFEIELGNELCRRADYECTWITNDWESIIPNLINGDYDTIIAGMTATEERDQLIDFTQGYVPSTPSVYVAAAGASDDVIAGIVATQVSTVQADYIAGTDATSLELDLAEEPITAVTNGEADAAFAEKSFLQPYIADSGGSLIFIGPEVDMGDDIGIGVREDDQELKRRLDEAIDAMKADNSLNTLIIKWFGEDAPTY